MSATKAFPIVGKFTEMACRIGGVVDEKNQAYGDSFSRCGEFLKTLYPNGIRPEQYIDALCLVRMFDKMSRIANGHYEDSYEDLAGYSLLGAARSEK